MGRRKTGLAEDIFTLMAAAPWWLGIVLAAVALIALQLAAGMEVRPPANAKGAGSFVVLQAVKSGASLLRWLLPPLLLAAAGVSYLKQRRTQTAAAAPRARGSSHRCPRASWMRRGMPTSGSGASRALTYPLCRVTDRRSGRRTC